VGTYILRIEGWNQAIFERRIESLKNSLTLRTKEQACELSLAMLKRLKGGNCNEETISHSSHSDDDTAFSGVLSDDCKRRRG